MGKAIFILFIYFFVKFAITIWFKKKGIFIIINFFVEPCEANVRTLGYIDLHADDNIKFRYLQFIGRLSYSLIFFSHFWGAVSHTLSGTIQNIPHILP